jgi:hypothetical protein
LADQKPPAEVDGDKNVLWLTEICVPLSPLASPAASLAHSFRASVDLQTAFPFLALRCRLVQTRQSDRQAGIGLSLLNFKNSCIHLPSLSPITNTSFHILASHSLLTCLPQCHLCSKRGYPFRGSLASPIVACFRHSFFFK